MLKIINNLRNGHLIEDIEDAFVQFFVEKNNIPISKNELLLAILNNNKPEVRRDQKLSNN